MITEFDLKNIFTAYVKKSVKHARIKYLREKNKYEKNVILAEKYITDRPEFIDSIPFYFEELNEVNIMDNIENYDLFVSMLKLNNKERKIINLHVFYKMKHVEIANRLGLTQSSVEKIYQRAIKKIKKDMEGE